jgi:predicted O-methyltransferase YrrM
VIECGTSFGVATIYMALAVNQNSHGQRKHESDIGITTIEKDGSKVARAKIIWKEAGTDVEKWIDAREGDLLEVLEQDETLPPVVDLVFLDGKTYPCTISVDVFAHSYFKHGPHWHFLH